MNQDRSRVRGEGWTESVDVPKLEVYRLGNNSDVRVKKKSAVKNNSQPFYLRGGRIQEAVGV